MNKRDTNLELMGNRNESKKKLSCHEVHVGTTSFLSLLLASPRLDWMGILVLSSARKERKKNYSKGLGRGFRAGQRGP